MARTTSLPAYRRHKQSGQAIVTLRNPDGTRKDYLLGPYNSAESRAEYLRLVSEWQENHQRIPDTNKNDLTVNELVLAFWGHVEQHYRLPDGTHTSEVDNFRVSLKPLRKLYGSTLVRDFGPLALKAIRRTMIDSGITRKTINGRITRIRAAFRWGVSEELVTADVLHALQAVDGLKVGRTEAKDRPKVQPVSDEAIAAVLPYLSPNVAAMVQVQRLTGMRPGEVCMIRLCDIDRSGPVWLYRPVAHKNTWRGKSRTIGIGPKAQAILTPFLGDDPEAYLFNPRRGQQQRHEAMRAARKSKVQPSQRNRKKAKPQRPPGAHYTPSSYQHAVKRACQRANVPHWHPNQLRHTFATEVRRTFGLDGAQATLGHSAADVTQVYAEVNAAYIAEIAGKIG